VITAVFGLVFFFSVLPGRASRNSAFRPSRPA
jgi:hypothetical protein